MLFLEDLAEMKCGAVGCTHTGHPMALNSRCHPQRGVTVDFHRNTESLILKCARCGEYVCEVKIGRQHAIDAEHAKAVNIKVGRGDGGKYDLPLQYVRENFHLESCGLMVLAGPKGPGFALAVMPRHLLILPELLRSMATGIESDLKAGKIGE